MEFTNRIKQILSSLNTTATEFAKVVGVQKSAVSHLIAGRNKPSLQVLEKIQKAYPNINAAYLLSGQLPVLNSLNKQVLESEHQQESLPFTDDNSKLSKPSNLEDGQITDVKNDKTSGSQVASIGHANANSKSHTEASSDVNPKHDNGAKKLLKVVLCYSDGSFEYYQV